MKLAVQKKLASGVLKRSKKKIKIDPMRVEELKEAITKKDIKGLIKDKAIIARKINSKSKARARKIRLQKSKGKRKGAGSKKGKKFSKISKKERWIKKIRAQRRLIVELRQEKKIIPKTYSEIYQKSKGGFFRSRRHILLYLEEHNLLKK